MKQNFTIQDGALDGAGAFLSVAQHPGLRRAAAELGVTPSAISQAVHAFEKPTDLPITQPAKFELVINPNPTVSRSNALGALGHRDDLTFQEKAQFPQRSVALPGPALKVCDFCLVRLQTLHREYESPVAALAPMEFEHHHAHA